LKGNNEKAAFGSAIMGSKKTLAIIIGLALLLACLVVLRSRPDKSVAASVSGTSQGPSFEVHVKKPLLARPFWEVPGVIFGFRDDDLRFDHTNRGAQIGNVGLHRLELSADGWHLFIETDSEGQIAQGTRLVFPLELAGTHGSLRCRPAERAAGYLNTAKREGSDEFEGQFVVEFTSCENAETGKAIAWRLPLTVRGSFKGLPSDRR
jgi:hypothetical protein